MVNREKITCDAIKKLGEQLRKKENPTEDENYLTLAEDALVMSLKDTNKNICVCALIELLRNEPEKKENKNIVITFLNSGEYEDVIREVRFHFSSGELHTWTPVPNWQ